jgi:Bacterial Ig domain
VTLLQIYLDGSKVQEVHEGQLAADIPMLPGSRRLTVQAHDAAGTFKTTQYIDVCALNPASPSVTICAPADGATISSPVRVLAGTTSTRPVKLVQVYVDGSKVYEEANHRLDWSLALSPGTHRLTVQAYDDLGGIFKSTVYVTVPGSL